MLEDFVYGRAATGNQGRKVDDGDNVGKVAEQDGDAIALHQPDREEQQRKAGQRVAEGDQSERCHEQAGCQDESAVVENTHHAPARQPVQAMRAADALHARHPDAALVEGSAELFGWQTVPLEALRQPQRAVEEAAHADEQDGGA